MGPFICLREAGFVLMLLGMSVPSQELSGQDSRINGTESREQSPKRSAGQSPSLRSVRLPAYIRSPPTKQEHFFLSEFGRVTPGGKWYVTTLVRHDKTAAYYGASAWGPVPMKEMGVASMGLVAINLKTGATRALLPAPSKATAHAISRGAAFFIGGEETCYVWLDESGEPAGKKNRNWGLEFVVYRWDLAAGELVPLGTNWVISEFVAAVGPSMARRIEWLPDNDRRWSGDVQLRDDSTGTSAKVPLIDAKLAYEDSFRSKYWHHRPRFLAGPRDGEVLVFHPYGRGPEGACLRALRLGEEGEVRWVIRKDDLQLGDRNIVVLRTFNGLGLNHRFVPLLVRSRAGGDTHNELFLFRSSDGSLVAKRRLSDELRMTGMAASVDGRLIGRTDYERQPSKSRNKVRRFTVLDVERNEITARREYAVASEAGGSRAIRPAGFDASNRLILGGAERVYRVAPPYNGPLESVFRLVEP